MVLVKAKCFVYKNKITIIGMFRNLIFHHNVSTILHIK